MEALGNQYLLELYNCDQEMLASVQEVEAAMLQAAEEAQATILHSVFHQFSPVGVSGVIVIQESHLTIHTWPELGYAAVDVFTCGQHMDPQASCEFLVSRLSAKNQQLRLVGRGVEVFDKLPKARRLQADELMRNVWFTQRTESLAFSLRHEGDLPFRSATGRQRLAMYDTLAFGRMLSLDGKISVAEGDEYIYHEMLVHVPMQSLAEVSDVLIVGGGDGAAAREVLRYQTVQSLQLVEQDMEVVSAVRNHFPQLQVPWEDQRLRIHAGDGLAYVNTLPDSSIDLLILDAFLWQIDPEPDAVRTVLQQLWRTIRAQGGMVIQAGAPRVLNSQLAGIVAAMKEIVGEDAVNPYLTYVPTYPTGTWSFVWANKGAVDGFSPERADAFALSEQLRYYNAAVHAAAFALPNDIRTVMT